LILIVPSEDLSHHWISVDDRLYKLVSNKTKLVN
jgi:hypothetical protein